MGHIKNILKKKKDKAAGLPSTLGASLTAERNKGR